MNLSNSFHTSALQKRGYFGKVWLLELGDLTANFKNAVQENNSCW